MRNSPFSAEVLPPEIPNVWDLAADLLDPQPDPYAADPVGFARDVLGFDAWSKQREIMESVRDHPRTSVRAGHGVGKTSTAAQIVLWFLAVHRDSRVITTAPTWDQVEGLLWREIRASVSRAHGAGKGEIFPTPHNTKLELGETWFAVGRSTNRPERFQGQHADHLLLVVDESSGVSDAIFEAAEGFQTAEGSKVLLIGNPNSIGGQFYRSFTSEAERWNQIHISVLDSPYFTGEQVPAHVARSLPTQDFVDDAATTYGADSPMYEVRVLGEFPTSGSDAVIPLQRVVDAQARNLPVSYPAARDDVTVAIDVARFGGDETVIATRHARQVRIRDAYNGRDTMDTVGRAIDVWKTLRTESGADPRFVVDDDGVGGGVTDRLREQGFEVVAFNGGGRAIEHDNYPNRRSELWFTMSRELIDLDLDPDNKLAADLTAPLLRRFTSSGQREVERKEQTKKRLKRSPDRGDAALLTLVRPPVITLPDPQARKTPTPRPGWMPEWEGDAPTGGSITGDLLNEEM